MSVEIFRKADFEGVLNEALSDTDHNWSCVGIVGGEYRYLIQVSNCVFIQINSTIQPDGLSADTGENSIRVWITDEETKPLGNKTQRWVTRVVGWQKRMADVLDITIQMAEAIQFCDKCGTIEKVFVVKKDGPNKGRLFIKCECPNSFTWLDIEDDESEQAPVSNRAEKIANKFGKKQENGKVPMCPKCGGMMVLRTRKADGNKFYGCRMFPACNGTRNYVNNILLNEGTVSVFKPSPYQQAVFDWVKSAQPGECLVVEALAGSGKTTTIAEASKFILQSKKVAMVVFNRHNVKPIQEKVPDHIKVCTYHSLGYAGCRHVWGSDIKVDEDKVNRILENVLDKYTHKHIFPTIRQIVSLVKSNLTGVTDEELNDIVLYYGIEINGSTDIVYQAVRLVIARCMEMTSAIDYDDMVWLPIVHNIELEKYDVIFVDEAQDTNKAQMALALASIKESGNIIAVGDRYQCHPTGTGVYKTGVGYVPIETVKVGDELASYLDGYISGINVQGRKVVNVISRKYSGILLHVKAGKFNHDVTLEHRCLVRMERRGGWAVYVMKRGVHARVGATKSVTNPAESVSRRARQEQADAAWILAIFDNRDDAYLLENLVAYNYGLPQVNYHRKWETKDNTIRTQTWLDNFWSEFHDNISALSDCLVDYGRDIRYPFWELTKNGGEFGKKKGSLYTFITQACNLINGWMRVCTFDGKSAVVKDDWKTVEVSEKSYKGTICGIELESRWRGHPVYIAQGIVTHNSMYGFRGADAMAIPLLIENLHATVLPLSITYRNPKSVVQMVNEKFSNIPLQAAEWAEGGVIRSVSEGMVLTEYAANDMVLCRTNAPLVSPVFELIRRGVKATIRGRDIGKGLIVLMRKMRSDSLTELLVKLNQYKDAEVYKLLAQEKNSQAQSLEDKVDTICALADGISSVMELEDRIENIFSDEVEGVVFSTIHRAKGLEAKRVFILHPELLPHPMAKKEWEVVQEKNIEYVAYTRTLSELIFVR